MIEIRKLVPASAWEIVKSIRIYANIEFLYDDKQMHGMHAHFSRDWLIENGNLPEKAGNVEIYSITDFVTWKQYQPAMLLHEMAH